MIKKLTLNFIKDIEKLDNRFQSHWSQELIKERITKFPLLSLGGFIDEQLIGFILGKEEEQKVTVSRIVVSKEYEGKGIGKKLLKFLEQGTTCNTIESVIRSGNKRSTRLHKSCGFTLNPNYLYRYENEELGLKFTKTIE